MKTYIWTLPTRLFHWILALAFSLAYLLGGEEDFLNFHAALGCLIGCLILFRVIQGFTGPRFARFRDFPVSLTSIRTFITNMKQSKALYPGHNPLASLIMLCIMIIALISALSGMLIFASGTTGFLGFTLNTTLDQEIVTEFHEIIVQVFLILVVIHLSGILVDTIFHPGNGTVFSIFTGYKNIQAQNVSLNAFQMVFSIFWMAVPILVFLFVLRYQPIPAAGQKNANQEVETEAEEQE